ncbi:uncharacterized protein LOC121392177 [Gigantopelta aegis]|uniref:uncharacterized protein LOC121392177 n=1 Tax=Gigantopelta aegis TaxID=1735272 RepID=UPI001B887E2F|nr:uncharacterized protein LOC121392177 [Gigantopelta aegis]
MSTTTAKHTIQELRLIFARFGLPEIIVTDNGPQFVSKELEEFTSQNGIRHSKVAPYHPRSNGLAERFVQTFKMAMKKMSKEGGDINQKLTNFLLNYRKTPQSTVKEAPAMLLMKRIPRSRLDLLVPNLNKKITERQEKQKKYFDKKGQGKEFSGTRRSLGERLSRDYQVGTWKKLYNKAEESGFQEVGELIDSLKCFVEAAGNGSREATRHLTTFFDSNVKTLTNIVEQLPSDLVAMAHALMVGTEAEKQIYTVAKEMFETMAKERKVIPKDQLEEAAQRF